MSNIEHGKRFGNVFIDDIWEYLHSIKRYYISEEYISKLKNCPQLKILQQFDDILYKSLSMWSATLSFTPEEKSFLPICVGLGGEIRRPRLDEGVFPEILNNKNLVINKEEDVFIVDSGVIAIDKNMIIDAQKGVFLNHLGWVAGLYNIGAAMDSNNSSWENVIPNAQARIIFRQLVHSKAGELLERLRSQK